MKNQPLIVGYVLALALFLFAQRHPSAPEASHFHSVIDLTYPMDSDSIVRQSLSEHSAHLLQNVAYTDHAHGIPKTVNMKTEETRIEAPATVAASLWTIDEIPPQRLIAPLVVLDVRDRVKANPDHQLSVREIADWERIHGEIPLGSVVIAFTGGEQQPAATHRVVRVPAYSADVVRFLIEGREVVGLGVDAGSFDAGSTGVSEYALSRSTYLLENVANLNRVSPAGAMVLVAPTKLENGTKGPVRLLALTR